MITINTYEQAKKLTSALFTVTRCKMPLNEFRNIFASQLGFKSLRDAYRNDNEAKLKKLQDNYITYLDDPRITLDVARIIQSYEEMEDHDSIDKYFKDNLSMTNDDILCPLKTTADLRKRCEQVLLVFNEQEWFSRKNYINLIMKMAMPQSRISYDYNQGDKSLENTNTELLMAKEIVGLNNQYSNFEELIEQFIDFDQISFENGFFDHIEKSKIFLGGIIWTQTNIGRGTTDKIEKSIDRIQKENNKKRIAKLNVKKGN